MPGDTCVGAAREGLGGAGGQCRQVFGPIACVIDDAMGIFDLIYRGIELYSHNRWPRDKVTAYSEACFRRQVRYAYAHCPFYRRYYLAKGIREADLDALSPEDIPPIDKDILRTNFSGFIARIGKTSRVLGSASESDDDESICVGATRNHLSGPENRQDQPRPGLQYGFEPLSRFSDDLLVVHSSGSTGKPANFLYSKSAIAKVIANFVRLSLGGNNPIGLGDFPIRTLFVASVGEGYASMALAFSGLREYHSRSMILDIQSPYRGWAERIQKFQPTYIAGYPSCLRLIAELQREKKIDVRPKKIITGGEPLTPELKSLLLNAFGADIIDYYASSESLFIGAGTSWYEGMYLFDDMNYVEVDPAGRLIITPLYNDVFPLVRYRLNDVAVGFSRERSGPLPYTHIDRLVGRSEEMMWFRNSKGEWDFLHPLFIDDLEVPGVREYQFMQTGEARLTVCLVAEQGTSPEQLREEAKKQVAGFLAKKGLQNVEFDVAVVEKLKTDEETGKSKLVVKQGRWGPGLET